MGAKSVKFVTEPEDQKRAFNLILQDLKKLQEMIENGDLNRETPRIGAEQELVFIDEGYRPIPLIQDFLKGIDDPKFTTELAQYNLEINLTPQVLTGRCFSAMEAELTQAIDTARRRSKTFNEDYELILTGILPTIRKMDLDLDNLTPNERSRAMIAAMQWLKQKHYPIRISGVDDLSTADFSNMFEACNTSFQIHYQLNPDEFVGKYNFAQAIAAPVLAAGTNSAILLGKRLWHETRIAVFQQAIDTRENSDYLREAHLRVPFGHEWVKDSVIEIFEDDLAKFKIFLEYDGQQPSENDSENMGHHLRNLNVFNSSIYRWTRACYGVLDGNPHLRIENRLLSSGPTIKDEMANTAFWVGLMHGMPEKYNDIASKMKFEDAKNNILKAARYGLDTHFRWLNGEKISADDLLLTELLPIAREGLEKASIQKEEMDEYLEIIERRVRNGQTGSQWQFDAWSKMAHIRSTDSKNVVLTAAMLKRQLTGKPVHEWTMPDEDELKVNVFSTVGQIMSTDIFSVNEDDLWDQTVFRMMKKNLEHIPVANKKGELKGMVTRAVLLQQLLENTQPNSSVLVVKDVMQKDPLSIGPETTVMQAIEIMKREDVKCLPIKYNNKLVGIVTEYDMMKVAEFLLHEWINENGTSNTQSIRHND